MSGTALKGIAMMVATAAKAMGTGAKEAAEEASQTVKTGAGEVEQAVKSAPHPVKPTFGVFRQLSSLTKSDPAQQKRDDLVAKVSISGMALKGGPAPKGIKASQPVALLLMQMKPVKESLASKVVSKVTAPLAKMQQKAALSAPKFS